METNKLNDEELEQINGGVYCPASSGIVDSRDKIVFRFNKGDIVYFKGVGTGFLTGQIVSQVYTGGAKGVYYPSYIVQSFFKNEMLCLNQDQIYIQY